VIALAHAAATWTMVGLIWTMQLVHYPALKDAAPGAFARNVRRTAAFVIPVMLIEAATAGALLGSGGAAGWTGAGLLALIWASTALIQYPLHRALSARYSSGDYERLLRTNRLRVAAWSARGVVALILLARGA
jgi:hypothetical protein